MNKVTTNLPITWYVPFQSKHENWTHFNRPKYKKQLSQTTKNPKTQQTRNLERDMHWDTCTRPSRLSPLCFVTIQQSSILPESPMQIWICCAHCQGAQLVLILGFHAAVKTNWFLGLAMILHLHHAIVAGIAVRIATCCNLKLQVKIVVSDSSKSKAVEDATGVGGWYLPMNRKTRKWDWFPWGPVRRRRHCNRIWLKCIALWTVRITKGIDYSVRQLCRESFGTEVKHENQVWHWRHSPNSLLVRFHEA